MISTVSKGKQNIFKCILLREILSINTTTLMGIVRQKEVLSYWLLSSLNYVLSSRQERNWQSIFTNQMQLHDVCIIFLNHIYSVRIYLTRTFTAYGECMVMHVVYVLKLNTVRQLLAESISGRKWRQKSSSN